MMPTSNNLSASACSVPSRSAAFGFRTSGFRLWTLDFGHLTSLLLALTTLGATSSAPAPTNTTAAPPSLLRLGAIPSPSAPEPAPPATPREFYDAGTRQLRAGKLREAETLLESALASQKEQLRPPTLYNLGLVRFGQGVEQSKKGPAAKPTVERGLRAAGQADAATR